MDCHHRDLRPSDVLHRNLQLACRPWPLSYYWGREDQGFLFVNLWVCRVSENRWNHAGVRACGCCFHEVAIHVFEVLGSHVIWTHTSKARVIEHDIHDAKIQTDWYRTQIIYYYIHANPHSWITSEGLIIIVINSLIYISISTSTGRAVRRPFRWPTLAADSKRTCR